MSQDQDLDALQAYIEKWERFARHTDVSIPLSRQLARLLPASSRLALRGTATRIVEPWSRRRAMGMLAQRRQVHLGCGRNHLPGWINVDLIGKGADVTWDIRRPLPFPDASVEAVFTEHVLEYMPYSVVIGVLREIRRSLVPGGVARVVLPDAGFYARHYATGDADEVLRRMRPGRPTPLLVLREVFQEYGHRTAFDADTLVLLFRAAGFDAVELSKPGSSRLQPCPDSPERFNESVYVEAVV